jgi:argininosuccinate synthase
VKRIVLGYSGGLETTVAIPWLAERFDAEVIALALDLGQGPTLVEVRERALEAGAARCHVIDVREEFIRDFLLHVLRAGALDEDRYPMGRVLSHALIVKKLVEVARMEGAATIGHGCRKGEDLRRFEVLTRALDPSIDVIATASTWNMSAADRIEYADSRGISLPVDSPITHSTIWGRSFELPPNEEPEEAFTLTCAPEDCPDDPAYVELAFEAGVPTSANGIQMPLVELMESAELIAGAHGVGRIAIAEGVTCEAPAAIVLDTAYSALEDLGNGRDSLDRRELSRAYADLIFEGGWFSTRREEIDALMAPSEASLTGSVRVKLEKGDCAVDEVGYSAPGVGRR